MEIIGSRQSVTTMVGKHQYFRALVAPYVSVPTKLSIGNTYNKIRFIKSINYELFYFRINITSMCFNKLHLLIYHCLVFKVAL